MLEGSSIVATFLLSTPRKRDFRNVLDPVIQVRALKDCDEADYASVVMSQSTNGFDLLGLSDDFAAIVKLSSEMASLDVESTPGGSRRIVQAAEIRSRFRQIAPRNEIMVLSEAQVSCLATYADGEYCHLGAVATTRLFDKALAATGDVFLIYLMRELDAREDCDSIDVGKQRIAAAIMDMMKIRTAMTENPSHSP